MALECQLCDSMGCPSSLLLFSSCLPFSPPLSFLSLVLPSFPSSLLFVFISLLFCLSSFFLFYLPSSNSLQLSTAPRTLQTSTYSYLHTLYKETHDTGIIVSETEISSKNLHERRNLMMP